MIGWQLVKLYKTLQSPQGGSIDTPLAELDESNMARLIYH